MVSFWVGRKSSVFMSLIDVSITQLETESENNEPGIFIEDSKLRGSLEIEKLPASRQHPQEAAIKEANLSQPEIVLDLSQGDLPAEGMDVLPSNASQTENDKVSDRTNLPSPKHQAQLDSVLMPIKEESSPSSADGIADAGDSRTPTTIEEESSLSSANGIADAGDSRTPATIKEESSPSSANGTADAGESHTPATESLGEESIDVQIKEKQLYMNVKPVRLIDPARRAGEGFNMMHIPKTAVTAFMYSVADQLYKGATHHFHEDCLEGTPYRREFDPVNNYDGTFLREPRSHLLSQYFQCEHGWDGINQANRKFPRAVPSGTLEKLNERKSQAEAALLDTSLNASDIEANKFLLKRLEGEISKVYKATVRALDKWLDYFSNHWRPGKGYFGCYHPKSMQTRAFLCRGVWDRLHSIYETKLLQPDTSLAISRMQNMWFVGISEYFHESMCMWEFQYHHKLPDYCICDSGVERPKVTSQTHGVTPHSLSDVSLSQMRKIDSFIFEDAQLYIAGLEEFKARVRYVEHITGHKMW
eukprot:CAMPEP_0171497628 /NCGR_PEP_ID=MMETSP0958-20121227/7382_1 /TAXON_ID=87120 /ORGANISM="Aurantiochytrium limacinum, Strain ATCCMYA-1381" /LENGTH=531 /DNA_ID=CAMNT_0012031901 /DNA_START=261 /DNA_END=1853 /DNA_ORIENTATION=-